MNPRLIIFACVFSGCCGLPLNPPPLRLDHEAAYIYDTLLEQEPFCVCL